MSDKRVGDLKIGWFLVSTLIFFVLGGFIFTQLSKSMKTIDEQSDMQKKITALEERVRAMEIIEKQTEAKELASPTPANSMPAEKPREIKPSKGT